MEFLKSLHCVGGLCTILVSVTISFFLCFFVWVVQIARVTAITGKLCGRPLPHMASLSRLHNASLGVAAISAAPKSYSDYGKTTRETILTNDVTFSESDSC